MVSLTFSGQSASKQQGQPNVDLVWKINLPKVKMRRCPVLKEHICHEIPFFV